MGTKATWKIADRAGDMQRGYAINNTACKNTKADIEKAAKKGKN